MNCFFSCFGKRYDIKDKQESYGYTAPSIPRVDAVLNLANYLKEAEKKELLEQLSNPTSTRAPARPSA